jgi:hypothetical protein
MLRAIRQATTTASAVAEAHSSTMVSRNPPTMPRASVASTWFLASSRSMSTLIVRSHSMNSGLAWVVSSVRACWVSPATRSSTTCSMTGRVRLWTSSMSASASRSSWSTFVSSAKISASGAAESLYFPASSSIRSISACTSAGEPAVTTSRRAMARSWTLPRKLIA